MRINQYHREQPNWRAGEVPKSGQLIGIELEVYNPNGRQESADALDNFDPGEYPSPIAERDGSLSETHGVEIICPPLPIKDILEPDGGYIGRLMKRLIDSGVTPEGKGGYGMHVNINLEGWSAKEKVLVQYLLNYFDLFGAHLGRRTTGFGSYDPYYMLRTNNNRRLEVRTFRGDRHVAAYIRRSHSGVRAGEPDGMVMEVRFPLGALDMEYLRNIIDYVFAIRDWVRSAPNHTDACCFLSTTLSSIKGTRVLHGLFLAWAQRFRPKVFDLLHGLAAPVAGHRLEVVQEKIRASRGTIMIQNTGLVNDLDSSNTGAKEQALRISTLIGKGAELTYEQATYGGVYASTVRAVS